MKICIVGSGGVGGYFGGLLAKGNNNVTFVARNNHFKAIKNKGLKVKSVKSGNFVIKPAKVINSISQIKNPDLIIFTVKTYHTKEVAKQLAKVVNKNTIVITFQNGVDNDNQIKKHLKAKVYPGSAYVISTKTKPGLIEQTGGMCKLIFGERKKSNNKSLKEIEEIFNKAGIDATHSKDIERDIWNKFIFIAAFSGMTALTRSPIGRVRSDSLAKEIYQQCIKEAISVAEAMKINVKENTLNRIMEISMSTSPDAKSSLLVDLENNRQNEIEALNGTIIKFAKKHNIKVPINKIIYSSIKIQSS